MRRIAYLSIHENIECDMGTPIKVGIFFGGPSKEREVSFAGGRTVYDNLDKALFAPIPIFVDSLGNFILLRWEKEKYGGTQTPI